MNEINGVRKPPVATTGIIKKENRWTVPVPAR